MSVYVCYPKGSENIIAVSNNLNHILFRLFADKDWDHVKNWFEFYEASGDYLYFNGNKLNFKKCDIEQEFEKVKSKFYDNA